MSVHADAASLPDRRLLEQRRIDDAVCADAARARTWNRAWAAIYGVTAVASAGFATFAPPEHLEEHRRAALYVTAAKASVGLLDKLVDPLRVDAAGPCDHDASASGWVLEASRRGMLSEAARRERRALLTSVVGGLAVNSIGLLYLGLGRHAWSTAWVSFGVGFAASVASALTAPVKSWLLERELGPPLDIAVLPLIERDGLGLAVRARW
ncbi:MAG TPA: hypothetical protein VGK52_09150 [Polyangia bacterium]